MMREGVGRRCPTMYLDSSVKTMTSGHGRPRGPQ